MFINLKKQKIQNKIALNSKNSKNIKNVKNKL